MFLASIKCSGLNVSFILLSAPIFFPPFLSAPCESIFGLRVVYPTVTVQRPLSASAVEHVLAVPAAAFTVATGNPIPKATVATAKHCTRVCVRRRAAV